MISYLLYFSPYENKLEQMRGQFNALILLALNDHLFLFTKYTDSSMFPLVANSVITMFWICIGVNFLLTFPPYLYQTILKFRKDYLRRKQRDAKLLREKQSKHRELLFVREQEDILNDIENRNWEM